jgi:hypothetical protein
MTLAGFQGDPEQQALLRAVLGAGEPAALVPWLAPGHAARHMQQQRGVQAYRANGQALAERALAAAYPVLVQMIGAQDFAQLAHHFWSVQPPLRGDMACWGDTLADFIDAAPQLAAEPCLGDVARLEWQLHLASSAADVELDLPSFALLASGDAAPYPLTLGAGLALLASDSPVASLVNAHLHGEPSLPEAAQRLADGCAEHALVWRQGFKPCARVSNAAEQHLLGVLLAGGSLLDALDALDAMPADGAEPFDFNRWLGTAVQTGVVCGALSLHTP